jgi:hypothetical protein
MPKLCVFPIGTSAADIEASVAKSLEQSKYAERRRLTLEGVRAKRLAELKARQESITRATALYAELDSGDHPEVRIRSSFIRLDKRRAPRDSSQPYASTRERDLKTRPPLTKLIHRPSNALAVLMTAFYVAHLENEPGKKVVNNRRNNFADGWSDLSGLLDPAATSKENNLRATRALGKLADCNLVAIGKPGTRNRFENFQLKRENGRGDKNYKVPGLSLAGKEALVLPAQFFYYGWHLVLTQEELATFLVIAMDSQRHPWRRSTQVEDLGIGLSRTVRWGDYGLAGEAYGSIHELQEFGLIDVIDPMPGRRSGKIKKPKKADMRAYRLIWPPEDWSTTADIPGPAVDVVIKCLEESPAPPRAV